MAIDYRSFSEKGPVSTPASPRWWDMKGLEMAQAIIQVVNTLTQADSRRVAQYQTSARLYGNIGLMGTNGLAYSRGAASQSAMRDKITYNVAQSCVDTTQAKMIKNKPKPLVLTSGGDWKMQRRAEKLSKFGDGIFYENDAYTLGREIFRDAAVVGDGFIHPFDYYGRCKYERVFAGELLVDEMEALYGEPRQMHRVKNIDRQVLAKAFPASKEAIGSAMGAKMDASYIPQTISDQVTAVESWHLPSGPEAKDGKHVICIDGATDDAILMGEAWDKDYFPFARMQWTPRLYGYWSQGGVEQIQNIQLEINKLLWVIQRSMHMAGTFKILAERGAKIVKEHFTNDFGIILEYTGTPPQYILPPIVPPEIYSHLQTLKAAAFEQFGVSQLSSSGLKPSGLDSKVALREMQDIESDRFQTIGQQYEGLYLDLFRMSVDVVKDIAEKKKGKYEVKVPGKRFLETIDWKDVKLEDDDYVQKIFPVSSLPSDPAGRLQTIQEYIQAGFISPRGGRRLLDFPDLEQAETMANSQEDWLHQVLEAMVNDGTPYVIEPEDDIQLAKELATQYIAHAKVTNVPADRIELLRDFLTNLNETTAAIAPPPMAGTPQAAPMPPPQSDMIPNVPAA